MSNTIIIDSFRPPMWLLRLGSDSAVARELVFDPMLFASFYASSEAYFRWPEELMLKIEDLKQSKSSHKDAVSMLADINQVMGGGLSADFIKTLNESAVVFDYFNYDTSQLVSFCKKELSLFEAIPSADIKQISTIEANIERLNKVCKLSKLESEILAFALIIKYNQPMLAMFKLLAKKTGHLAKQAVSTMFDCSFKNLQSFMEDSWLTQSGLISFKSRNSGIPEISHFWAELFLTGKIAVHDNDEEFFSYILSVVESKESSGSVARIQAEDKQIIEGLLKAKSSKAGLNILLHGDKSLDKKGLAQRLISQAGLRSWEVSAKAAEVDDYPSLCFVAQKWLEKQHKGDILIVDKAQHVLSRSGYHPALSFFGISKSEDEDTPTDFDNVLLDDNPIKTVWLVSSPKLITESSLASFTFHAEVRKASRSERKAEVEAIVRSLNISDAAQSELIKMAGLSQKQVANAVRLAKLLKIKGTDKIEQVLLHAVDRSQKALDRREIEELRTPVTTYSLEYLNTTGAFSADKIITALKKNPKATVCFYGLPGTGKTQLAEHIAVCLDKPILMKRASELIDKYIGESEKNIAQMFIEAEEEDAVLLLDEADSFLRDRALARHSWEVSQVNELLQRMERFKGTFICATNLFSSLDSAALRRFTFKLEFLALTPDQRWQMFLNEAGLRGFEDTFKAAELNKWQERLNTIKWLTPGDFATIKRQSIVLDEILSPTQWLDQLESEVAAKSKSIRKDNDIQRSVGFTATEE